ncbi:MAG: XRE family transcriptional regulator [Proteobacteria bacterium]|nr:XRE family transcriptional regulator [Pseudomonadota bacterium]
MEKQLMPINPEVLRWARESIGYSLEEVSRKQGLKKFGEWERGEVYPTYAQLEKISVALRRPIAVFFFPAPPKEATVEKALRSISPDDVHNLSPAVRLLFRKAQAFQVSLRELHAREEMLQTRRIAWLNRLQGADMARVAHMVREVLGVSLEAQHSWPTSEVALKEWRAALAQHGVYVFKEAFRDDKISGFCIYDDLYPIIFINNSMESNRQIFTIFHELAHLLFKDSYLDIFDQRFWDIDYEQSSHTEAKCNEFAGEFLVPKQAFSQTINAGEIDDATLVKLSLQYKVSKEVILRRFLTWKLIDRVFYTKKLSEWRDVCASKQYKERKTSNKAKGNYYNSKMSYLGDAYLALVLREYHQGKIDLEEASAHLDIKSKAFAVVEEKFLNRKGHDVYF